MLVGRDAGSGSLSGLTLVILRLFFCVQSPLKLLALYREKFFQDVNESRKLSSTLSFNLHFSSQTSRYRDFKESSDMSIIGSYMKAFR